MIVQVMLLAFCDYEQRLVEIPDGEADRAMEVNSPENVTLGLLQSAFHFGQNDFQPQKLPSVSVGDVISLKDAAYLVCNLGFRKLTAEEYFAYRQMPREQRPFWAMTQEANV